ncbi:FAD-dependent monooxygenase [Streptomyces atratus]|uniref:FAD-dependent monooxygenase n=1 Tax=Streptomyces atratus TaxID=1893 RepID=UPI0022515FF7|nr:FAD-dependent monooxygenase [Streptomyces atratus]MCX5339774.1 FAD-dependent monooxygenase [Streptomyces atratus]
MTVPEAPDVLVVGAGPSGLLLAGILARGGARVTVLESRSAPNPQTRASTLHARAMEIFDSHGVEFAPQLPWSAHGHYGGLPVDLSNVRSERAGVWRCPQPELVRTLSGWACHHGVRLLYGEHVESVHEQGQRCSVKTRTGKTFGATLLVAADGQESTVRSLLGIGCGGAPATRVLVQADLHRCRLPKRRFERRGRYTVTAAPLSAEVTRVMIHDPHWPAGETRTPEDLRTAWQASTGEVLPAEPSWLRTFSDDTKVAHRLVEGRVVLCGDAAHPFIPIGGQTLNTSLMDAEALGWRVLRYLDTGDPHILLDYQQERSSWLNVLARRLRAQARLLFDTDEAATEHKARVAEHLNRDEVYRERIADCLAGVDVCYLTATGAVRRRLSPAQLRQSGAAIGATRVQRGFVADNGTRVDAWIRPDSHWYPIARDEARKDWDDAVRPLDDHVPEVAP